LVYIGLRKKSVAVVVATVLLLLLCGGARAASATGDCPAGTMTDSCCPPGSLPALQEDAARALSGSVIDNRLYYSAPPTASTLGIVVIYDVHGFSGGRIKSVCDQLALAGFHVVMPDVYEGSSIGAEGGFGEEKAMAWLKAKSDYTGYLKGALKPAFEHLTSQGVTSVGAIGFCWGAYGVTKLSCDGLIHAGVSCHPSLKIGNMFFAEAEADQVKPAKAPLLFLPAGNDPPLYTDGTLVADDASVEVVAQAFPEMKHGWVPRGDAADAAVARDVEAALKAATDFLGKHLKATSTGAPAGGGGTSTKETWAELVGADGEAAVATIRSERPDLAVVETVPADAMVTMDFREDRVRVFVDDAGKVAQPPKCG